MTCTATLTIHDPDDGDAVWTCQETGAHDVHRDGWVTWTGGAA